MPPAYEPQAVEAGWYARWEAAQLFKAEADTLKPRYSIALPPPNVTGELHMGHAAREVKARERLELNSWGGSWNEDLDRRVVQRRHDEQPIRRSRVLDEAAAARQE